MIFNGSSIPSYSKRVGNDGLVIPEVGAWSQIKYNLISHYAHMFATSMKNKWNNRIYIDLFSGAGYSRIKNTDEIIESSPIITMRVPDKFDKYIFADIIPENIQALRARISREFNGYDHSCLECDVNSSVTDILALVPTPSKGNTVLTFCLVDPFKISNLKMSTLEEISKAIYVDFLVLIPSRMDAGRNLGPYLNHENKTMDEFLGMPNWREDWELTEKLGKPFWSFVVEKFCEKFESFGFLPTKASEIVPVNETGTQRILYHLTFFSKNELGKKFWCDSITGCDPQIKIFDQ
ncbi:MAG: three-Cys-motif partner protein TcmP [Candidatus Marinimicrobia bacterium]|nr:three-Cys-motif partner protein TcmP [Candidatus Neomarinimicrobiota bacterium]